MDVKITLEELLDYIEHQIEKDELSIIHIYDFGKQEKIFDLTIEPYDRNKTEYFELDMDPEKLYDVVFDALKDIYPNETKILTSQGYIYGDYSVQLMIAKNIWIIMDFYTKDGQNWMKEIYSRYH